MSKSDKNITKEIDEMKSYKDTQSSGAGNELLEFFIGVILLGVGLFMLSKNVVVHSGWYTWSFGRFDVSSGTVTIPLIIGIIWYFINSKSIAAKLIIILSTVFIIVSIIMSVRITFTAVTMFDYILMFGMMAAGVGLVLKTLFKKK